MISPPALITISLETSFNQLTVLAESQVFLIAPDDPSSAEALVDSSSLPLPPTNPVLVYSYVSGLFKYTVNHTLVWTNINTEPSGGTGTSAITVNTTTSGTIDQTLGDIVGLPATSTVTTTGSAFGRWLRYSEYGGTDQTFTGEFFTTSEGTYNFTLSFINRNPAQAKSFGYLINNKFVTSVSVNGNGATITGIMVGSGVRLRFTAIAGITSVNLDGSRPVTITVTKTS